MMKRVAAALALLVILLITAGALLACPLEEKPCCPRESVAAECLLDCPYLAAADRATPALPDGAIAPPLTGAARPSQPIVEAPAAANRLRDQQSVFLTIRVLRI